MNKLKRVYHHSSRDRVECFYSGYELSEEYVVNAFQNEVRERLFDTKGTEELIDTLGSTGFDAPELKEVLSLEEQHGLVKDWRIGEELTEIFLEKHFKAFIPYNSVRDAKNPGANATGTDIVGFIPSKEGMKFLFVEVKTSNQAKSPPSVVYGMTKQIEDLISENSPVSKNLIRYLAFHAKANGFLAQWKEAVRFYIKRQYVVFGSLVRDTQCDKKDLDSRFNNNFKILPPSLILGMIALYLPQKMDSWVDIVLKGGAADVH